MKPAKQKAAAGRFIAPGVGVLLALLVMSPASDGLAANLLSYSSSLTEAARRSFAGPRVASNGVQSVADSLRHATSSVDYAVLASWLIVASPLLVLFRRRSIAAPIRIFAAPHGPLAPRAPPSF